MLEKVALDQLLRRLEKIEFGSLEVTTPDGAKRSFAGTSPGPAASLEIRDARFARQLVRNGDIGLAQEYRAGSWETDDLVALMKLGLLNRASLDELLDGSWLSRLFASLHYLLRSNTLRRSVANIHAHYDLGNDFYALWLDPTMTYSSALFAGADETLEQGQLNKYDRILERLGRNSGALLEIGCGWGGFMARAASRGDYALKGLTLSAQQHAYAKEHLGGSAQVAREDYRVQQGSYDHIVSIEMFEAVGKKYWPVYFRKIAELLGKGGRAVIQAITINEQDYPSYEKGGDFIRSFIFPGGMLPTPTIFAHQANLAGLQLTDCHTFGQDYVRTLGQWLATVEAKAAQIGALGLDDGFIRLWRLYLASCLAGFATERTNVMQVELRHLPSG